VAVHYNGGILYEMVSVMVYEKKYNTRVADFGCIQHINHSFIGASPDGINVDPKSDRYGRMIEIKNIVNRDITDKPKRNIGFKCKYKWKHVTWTNAIS